MTEKTVYSFNLCILPTMKTDSFENYSEDEDNYPSLSSLVENWIKFKNYALINKDQVIITSEMVSGSYSKTNILNSIQAFVVKFFKKDVQEGCNQVTVYHEGSKYTNYKVVFF